MAKHTLLTLNQETKLIQRAQNQCTKSLTLLVHHNQRLIHKEAQKYHKGATTPNPRIEYDDLYQHGVTGLIHAIHKFDTTSGYKLSTYACWWIRKEIRENIAKNIGSLHVPRYIFDKAQRGELTEQQAQQYAKASDAISLQDLTTDIAQPPPEDSSESCKRLKRVFDKARLTSLEATALTYHYGLFEHPSMTVKEAHRETGIPYRDFNQAVRSGRAKLKRVAEDDVSGQRLLFD